MSDRKDIDVEALKIQLIERRDELNRLLTAHRDNIKPVILDQTTVGRLSRMDELQTQAMSIETERRRKDECIASMPLYRGSMRTISAIA